MSLTIILNWTDAPLIWDFFLGAAGKPRYEFSLIDADKVSAAGEVMMAPIDLAGFLPFYLILCLSVLKKTFLDIIRRLIS